MDRANGPLSPPFGALVRGSVNPDRNDGVNGGQAEILAREAALGRTYDIMDRFYPFTDAIPTSLESWDVSMGTIPMITWGAPSDTIELASGVHDAWLTQQADRLAAFGSPIFLRFFHEMDGGYRQTYMHSAQDFIAAWRHVHDLFVQEGATNVVWIWCPTSWSFVTGSPWPPNYYPGDAYVDWIASDGYSWYPRAGYQVAHMDPDLPALLRLGVHGEQAHHDRRVRRDGGPGDTWQEGLLDLGCPTGVADPVPAHPGRAVLRHTDDEERLHLRMARGQLAGILAAFAAMGADPDFAPPHGAPDTTPPTTPGTPKAPAPHRRRSISRGRHRPTT